MGRKKKNEDGDPSKITGKEPKWFGDPYDTTDIWRAPVIDVKDIEEEIDNAPPLSYFKENIKDLPKPKRKRRKKTEFDELFKDPLIDLKNGLEFLKSRNPSHKEKTSQAHEMEPTNNTENNKFGLFKYKSATEGYPKSVNSNLSVENNTGNSSNIDGKPSSQEFSDSDNLKAKDTVRATSDGTENPVKGDQTHSDEEEDETDDYTAFKIMNKNISKKISSLADKDSTADGKREKKKDKKEKRYKYKTRISQLNKELKAIKTQLKFLMKKYPLVSEPNKREEPTQNSNEFNNRKEAETSQEKMYTETVSKIPEEKIAYSSNDPNQRNDYGKEQPEALKDTNSVESKSAWTERRDETSTISGLSFGANYFKKEEPKFDDYQLDTSLLHSTSKTRKTKTKKGSRIKDTIKTKKGKERKERNKSFKNIDDLNSSGNAKNCSFHDKNDSFAGFRDVNNISESNTLYGTLPMPLDGELLVDPDHSYQKIRERHISNFLKSTLQPGDGYVLSQ